MNNQAIEPLENASESATARTLAELERRVLVLESSVAVLKDTRPLEDRIAERVRADLPSHPAPPTFKDFSMPVPSVDSMVATAKATWALFEMLNELKLLFWMLFDRRYHMGWLTRVMAIGLVFAILTSGLWLPLAFDNIVGHLWEKIINLLLGFVMFFILHYEMRRYRDWLKHR